MYGENQLLDSYQNPTGGDRNESVESISSGPDHDSVEHAGGEGYDDEPNPERLAGDLSSDRAEGDRKRRSPAGHGSGDRNESAPARPEAERGRAASGESYEDEADNAMFRRKKKAVTTDTYEGGNLGPGGRLIEKASGRKRS